MTRSTFGGTSVDWLLSSYQFGARTLLALRDGTTTLTFWSAASGGTQYTDLLDPSAAATDRITFPGHLVPAFSGPDGILAMWADKGDGSPRERMEAQDLAAAASAVADAEAARDDAEDARDTAIATLANTVTQGQLVSYAAANGVTGNGSTDDSAAFLSWLTAASALGARTQLAAGSVVKITGTQIDVPSGTRLDGNGATIKNARAGTTDRLLVISGKSDIVISNLVLDGDKASYGTTTEQRHNIHVVNSQRIRLENVTSKNAKGDGIYIGDDTSGYSSDVTLINVSGTSNHRNGLSITAVSGFKQYGGSYTLNGGTSPQSGCDIEPNTDAALVEKIAFYGVNFDSNAWDGVLVQAHSATLTARQGGVRFYGCSANGNGTNPSTNVGNGVVLRWANDVAWIGGEIRGNALRGVYFRDTCTNLRFDTDVVANLQEGYAQPAGTITGLRIQGLVSGNGTSGTLDGVNLAGSGSFALLSGAFNANTRYGVRTLSGWSSVTIAAGSSFTSNTTGTVSLGDDAASRLVYARSISGGVIPVGRSTTALRPAAASVSYGIWIDTDLNKIIWSNGSTWRDAMGNTV